jgi:hypothetical protein
MGSRFNDVPLIQNNDAIDVANGREPAIWYFIMLILRKMNKISNETAF